MKTSDVELLAAFRGGDRDAFQALVLRWSPRVMEVASRLLGDRDRARDVHQQIFLRLWTGRATFEGRSRFSTWLHQVVVNSCRDLRRADGVGEAHVRMAGREGNGRATPRPEALTEEEERSRCVAAAVRDLPDEEREVLMLKHFAELSFARVAEVLDIPASTAKSRLGRALDRLAHKLKDLER
jgi:RNA polymerase sigma-70 factor (ECF subfamily)